MLTPTQVTNLSKRMDKLCTSYQEEVAEKIPEFLAFLGKPNLTRADKIKAVREFRAYMAKVATSLRRQSNRVVVDTFRQAALASLRADRRLAERAAAAGADLNSDNAIKIDREVINGEYS